MNSSFYKMCLFPNAEIATDEFSDSEGDWKICKINSFNVLIGLIYVFHPIKARLYSLDPANADGFLILKRLNQLTEDECIKLACIAMDWNEEYVWFSGKDDNRFIVQNTKQHSKEFNVGLNSDNGKLWVMDIEIGELNQIKNYPKALSYLYENNYAFDYMFDEVNCIATELKDL